MALLSYLTKRHLRKKTKASSSVEHFLDSSLRDKLNNFSKFAKLNANKEITVGFLELENIATLLYSYGVQTTHSTIDTVMQTFYGHFASMGLIERAGIDKFAFIIAVPYLELSPSLQALSYDLRLFKSQVALQPIYLNFHIGISMCDSNLSLEQNLGNAYIALFEAKARVGEHISYFSDIEESMLGFENQLKLAAYFQRAISEKRLKMAYQPIICSKTGKVKHHEALLRIVTEDNKIISAGPFIPIAESMGYIDQIDNMVLELVVEELKQSPDITLALNVSNLSIDNTQWWHKAKKLFNDPMVASRAIIEITETGVSRDLRKVADFVDKMQSLGCQVAIDDFGSGYTSFMQLKTLHADIIKIDGIFIRDIVNNHDSRLFVQTLLQFAKSFAIKTVAEFVETGEIAKVLIDLQVDYMQGNYFSPALNYRSWIKEEAPHIG